MFLFKQKIRSSLKDFNSLFSVDYLYSLFQKKAPLIDKKLFVNNEKNQLRAARFFFLTSFITKFFLFSKIGKFLVFLLFIFTFFSSTSYFQIMVAAYADLGFYQGLHFMIVNLPSVLFFLIIFVLVIVDLSLINTFLVTCESVSLRIQKIYGEDFIKNQFYNSATLTAKASAQ